jgi:dihydroorotase
MENVKNVLIRQVTILDPSSMHHLKKRDVHIQNGKIMKIAPSIKGLNIPEIDIAESFLTHAFVDLQTRLGEPGNEIAETFETVCQSAISGGYGSLLAYPSHSPATTQAAQISYIQQNSRHGIKLLAAGCISENMDGAQLAELFDMHRAGAMAFTDDKKNLTVTLLSRALEYTKTFNGLLITYPLEPQLNPGGLMHEGKTSTLMGTKGLSDVSETMRIQRDLEILKYVGGKLHFSNISAASSVDLIRKAKKQKLPITCSISAHQLSYLDEDLLQFPSNLKVLPPFRSNKDRQALIDGLGDDTIDCIVSDHTPVIIEDKAVEFEYAHFGISSLPTAFLSALTATEGDIAIDQLVKKFNAQPAQILGVKNDSIEESYTPPMTLFTLSQNTSFSKENWKSKSYNSPFIGETLRGSILHTFLPKP